MAERPSRQVKKSFAVQRILMREQQRNKLKEVRRILKKSEYELTPEESKLLHEHSNIVKEIQQRNEKHMSLRERAKEVIDVPDIVEKKCQELAEALRSASSVILYTGAGISTAANIPDYRGPEGVWTLLRKGKKIEVPDLSIAEPTFTHMAIKELHKRGFVKHVVSQNCDGLHIRSGLPPKSLSEIHGNMFIEVCMSCKPVKQYRRLFDVTENTALHRHGTGRFCLKCGSELKDTIVHFGEKGKVAWPLNWKGAVKALSEADLILCLGSSLKVLKRYPCLWANHLPQTKRPKLFIVNLQWTPKDTQCSLKIHAKCDDVMKYLTSMLEIQVPSYRKDEDPLFLLAVPLSDKEIETRTRKDIPFFALSEKIKSSADSDQFYSEDNKCNIPPNAQLETLQTDSKINIKEKAIDLAEQCQTSSRTTSPGWYGKGCAKMKKPVKRKRL